ncbi:TraE/TraK family type IV conjugative transfer system protein [Marinobacter sp. P4B1]|uniref:TraE/TraK family type IV conjugative transfer system protein n=1 Tax=Marinobacter sp. P4B1 TaxID=1119533 RepID=UPI00071DCBDF|nr:TraE/TraK family type IV conjugative transfer system protein [Marinobacter sp. P4B1]KRW83736.1 hypothetical protein AQ621_16945 [Marinobacter sp. P4B1]
MELKKLKQTWSELRLENLIHRFSLPVLAIALVVSISMAANKDPVVVFSPPEVFEKMEVGYSHASESYKLAMGLTFSAMLGNVHAGTANFYLDTLSQVIHPSTFREVKSQLESEIQRIKNNDLSISFIPRSTAYWPDTNRVVIYGQRETQGRGDRGFREEITYEMEIEVQNYRPQITAFRTYEGKPERDVR